MSKGEGWEPGRWWRVIYADNRLRPKVWCETSSEDEARAALQTCPGGGVLQRLYVRTQREWRSASGV